MFICNAAIDLKINEQGEIKILEFESANHAGYDGYRSLTGKDMMDDIVYPWMEEFFNVPVERPDADSFFSDIFLSHIFEMADSLDRYKLNSIIVSPRYYCIQSWMMQHNKGNGLSVPIVSANAGFQQLATNKAYMDFLATMAENSRKECLAAEENDRPDDSGSVLSLFPDTAVCPRDYDEAVYQNFHDEMGHYKQFVLKLANESQHHGLVLANRENIDSIIHQLCERGHKGSGGGPKLPKEWKENNAPLYVIQEKVKSRPVEKGGKKYDGTMRVFATIWYEMMGRENSSIQLHPHIHVHEAYWKLPPNPIGPGHAFNQCVSFCPSSIDDDNPDKMALCREHFALVSDADKELVAQTFDADKMKFFLTQMLVDSIINDPAEDLLFLDVEGSAFINDLGAMLALNTNYYNGGYIHASEEKPYELYKDPMIPDHIFNRLSDIYNSRPENSFLRRYMNDIANDKDYHFVLADKETQKRLRELASKAPAGNTEKARPVL